MKIPIPCNVEAERAVLGAMLTDYDDLNEAMATVGLEDFFAEPHKAIFATIAQVCEDDGLVSVETIWRRLQSAGETRVKADYLAQVGSTAPKSYYVSDFVQDLKLATAKRKFLALADKIYTKVHSSKRESPDDMAREFEDDIFAVVEKKTAALAAPIASILTKSESVLDEIQKRQQARKDGQSALAGAPTHFVDFDKKIPGLSAGHLIIVGARPRVGKTTFALNIIHRMTFLNNVGCLFFSLEMTQREIGYKLLALVGDVSYQKMIRGEIDGGEYQSLKVAEQAWLNKCLIVDDQSGLGVDQIKSRAFRLKRKWPIGLVLVDYIQLVGSKKKFESRQLEVADVSRQLKSLAKDLGCPVMALAQLNREVEKRTGQNKRPQLSDLRESGSLEADADEVILLHRPELDNAKESPGILQLHIEKNRFGETGLCELYFKKDSGRIENYQRATKPEPDDGRWGPFSP